MHAVHLQGFQDFAQFQDFPLACFSQEDRKFKISAVQGNEDFHELAAPWVLVMGSHPICAPAQDCGIANGAIAAWLQLQMVIMHKGLGSQAIRRSEFS